MKTVEMIGVVGPDGKIVVQLPPEILPGEHHLVVVIEEKTTQSPRPPLQLSAYPVGLVSDAFTFRREDLYDDDGR